MAGRVRAFEWDATPLGRVEGWPQPLRTAVELMLASPMLATLVVGPERVFLYNDEAARHYGERHPGALGCPLAKAFAREFHAVAAFYDQVFAGESLHVQAQPLDPAGDGTGEVFEASLLPVRDAGGTVIAASMTGFAVGERVRADAALRESEERQRFLLSLSDALRPLADAAEIQATTTRLLGAYLGVDRAMYAEVTGDRGAEAGVIRGQFFRPAAPGRPAPAPFPDHFTYETFGAHVMARRYSGEGLAVADVNADPGFDAAERAAWARVGVQAAIVTPLVKGGRLVAELGVHSETPRTWTDAEVSLVREAGERTWAAAERARAEAALRTSERRYHSLFHSMDEAYAVVEVLKDRAGTWADFRFLEVNPAFMAHTSMPYPVGRTATELLGTPNPRWTQMYGQVLDTGRPIRVKESEPTLGRTFDLNIFPLDRERNRVAVLFTNITERVRTEAALRVSEERLRLALDAAEMGSFVWYPEEDRAEPDQRMEALFGPEGARNFRVALSTLVHPDDRDRYASAVSRALDPAGNGVLREEVRVVRPEGRECWLAVAGQTRFGTGRRRVTRMAGIVRDITERKLAEASLRESEVHNAFLVRFSDAVRGLSDPRAVAEAACRLVAEQLGTERAYWAEVDWASREYVIGAAFHVPGVPVIEGRFPLDAWEPFTSLHLSGRPVVVSDTRTDPRIPPAMREGYARIAVGADLAVPVLVNGTLRCTLAVNGRASRPWTPEEVALVQGIAGRCWAEVERARAEAALWEAAERQAFLLALGDAMRAEPSAGGKIETAARHLGERLRASRVLWAEYDWQKGLAHIFSGWFADGAQPFPTVMQLKDYDGEVLNDLRAGRTVRVDHVGLLVAEPAYAAIAAVGVQALLSVPLLVGGRLVVNVSIHQHEPRRWSDGDVALVQDVAERLWAEVARARTEAALAASEERFRAFAEHSADTIWIASGDGTRLEYLSPAFERMFGEDRAAVMANLGRWAELLHPDDREAAMRAMPRTLAGEMAIVHYRVVRPSDGRLVHLRDTGFPIRDGTGAVVRVAGIVQDVSDMIAAREALEAEKERFQTLAEGIPPLVWRSLDQGRWAWASPQWQDYTGQGQEESHGLGWLDAVHPEDREQTMAAWHEARLQGRLEVEHRVWHALDGAWRWHQTRSLPVRNGPTTEQPEGQIVEWLGTTADIENLKRLQSHQAVLVAELQHRTRNLLAVVRNVARRSIPPSRGRDEYDDRLATLGRVQGFLTRSAAWSVSLEELVQAELTSVGNGRSAKVTVSGPAVQLPGDKVETVALALHELATNAMKYGALARDKARLAVKWHVEQKGSGGDRLVLEWRESGVEMPQGPPSRRGYGSELIERALPYQLKAETRREFTPDGVHCIISLPLEAVRLLEDPA
ncbi:PAS domain S-box protein [Muricoccus radiodurans]|uniref:PAS domain S-box protein n=1 Tax=Muricoccus radiodurans TaxID=2231721 RepID=UPI003CF7154C